jgi:hypothetical protein
MLLHEVFRDMRRFILASAVDAARSAGGATRLKWRWFESSSELCWLVCDDAAGRCDCSTSVRRDGLEQFQAAYLKVTTSPELVKLGRDDRGRDHCAHW